MASPIPAPRSGDQDTQAHQGIREISDQEASGRTRRKQGSLVARLARLPRSAKIGIATAAVVVIAAGAITIVGLSERSAPSTPPAADKPTPSANTPLPDVQQYRRPAASDAYAFGINVPKGWTMKTSRSSYVDFVDPVDSKRYIRINVAVSGEDVHRFFDSAERSSLKNVCTPYAQVGVRDIRLGGRDGGELEYTCGQGDQQRHGIWGAVVRDRKAYNFYLSVPSGGFTSSHMIYDEMVRSFAFAS